MPAGRGQHAGAGLTGGKHLSHLLRGGPVPEAGAVEEGVDALGKERGTTQKLHPLLRSPHPHFCGISPGVSLETLLGQASVLSF